MFWNMFIVCIELIVVVIVQCYGVSVWYVCMHTVIQNMYHVYYTVSNSNK